MYLFNTTLWVVAELLSLCDDASNHQEAPAPYLSAPTHIISLKGTTQPSDGYVQGQETLGQGYKKILFSLSKPLNTCKILKTSLLITTNTKYPNETEQWSLAWTSPRWLLLLLRVATQLKIIMTVSEHWYYMIFAFTLVYWGFTGI